MLHRVCCIMKKSYQTSEFWFTLVSFIISGLFLGGIISEPDTKDDLINAVTHGVESVILIGGQFMVLSRYLKKRKEEKLEHEKTKQKEQENLHNELKEYVGIDKRNTKININKASVGELIRLPHIGPSTANHIIQYRVTNGDFQSIKEIIFVSGVGKAIFKEIKGYITV